MASVQCPNGVCTATSAINNQSLEGWKWPSNADLQKMFNSFSEQNILPDGSFSERESSWAGEIFNKFRATQFCVELCDRIGIRAYYRLVGLSNDAPIDEKVSRWAVTDYRRTEAQCDDLVSTDPSVSHLWSSSVMFANGFCGAFFVHDVNAES